MLVIHGVWSCPARLYLWAEDSSSFQPPRRGRPPRTLRHQFACDSARLRETAAGLAGLTSEDLGVGEATLLLPSLATQPLPSPEFPHHEQPGGPPELKAWRVPVVSLEPADALDVLLSLPEEREPGLAVGASLRFFGVVARLALELVARGRLLPFLVKEAGGFAARWRSMPVEQDAGRLRLLAASMPPASRAEAAERGARPPDHILREALDSLVDVAARSGLQGPLLPTRRGRPRTRPPVAAAWLRALGDGDATVVGEPTELQRHQAGLEGWRKAGLPPPAPLRTCFRISPPDGEAGGQGWRVEFLLQASDDPSLLVPASDVWRVKGRLAAFERVLDDPHERLLADLGRASRLSPELEEALQVAKPVELNLDVQAAYRFLQESVPLLAEAGFGVMVPPWWQAAPIRLGARLRARPKGDVDTGSGLLGMEGLYDYRWELALGDQALSLDELRELASLKAPLVQVRGRWVELRPQEIERALAFLERQEKEGPGEINVAEALRLGLGLEASEIGLPVVGVEAEGWLGDLLTGAVERRLQPLATPAGFGGRLRPYQERGLAWLGFLGDLGLGACLADDMGLGKTVQLLALLVAERADQAGRSPTLLVCPMSVVGNWQREADRFASDLRVLVHHGSERLTGRSFGSAALKHDLVLTTYALAARDRDLLAQVPWGRVVLDEAQNVKNPASRQAQAVRSLKAPCRVALTGTPVENRLSELWSIMDFLNPGLLGPASDFRRRFAIPVERYRDEQVAAQLKRATQPFILRRLKTDRSIISDLPDKIEMKVFCNVTREQATLYQAVLDEMLARIEESEAGIKRRGLVLATMMKLKQVCNHPRQLLRDGSRLEGRSGKLARTEELLEEALAEGDRALVFTQFAEWGALLQSHLEERFGSEVLFLHGGTPKGGRDEMVARFQSGSGPSVFILSLKAGGTGLNLTAANQVIHFDRWWNPAVEDQATDRAFRIGQRKGVQVRKLVCVGTLEERIDRMIEQKKELTERIVGSGEDWLTELSTSELRDVVKLSAEAVAEG